MNVMSNNDLQCTVALAALEGVIDPEIGLNIVDLGLIYRIQFAPASSEITVRMTLSTPFCPMGESIVRSVEDVLRQTFVDMEVTVELTFEPPWDASRISPEGKKFLSS